MGVLNKKDLKVLKSHFNEIEFNGRKYSVIAGKSSKAEHEYNNDNKVIKTTYSSLSGEVMSTKLYTYNEKGHILYTEDKIIRTGGDLLYKNPSVKMIETKYFEDEETIKESHNPEYDLEVELSKDGIYTTTVIYRQKPLKIVQMRDSNQKPLSEMKFVKVDENNWGKIQGILYKYYPSGCVNNVITTKYNNANGEVIGRTKEHYSDGDELLYETHIYDKDGNVTYSYDIGYDFHHTTKEPKMKYYIINDNGKETEFRYEYLDDGRICLAKNVTTNEEVKVGFLTNDVYHFIDYEEGFEMYSNDHLDEIITKNEIGITYSYQFKDYNNSNCTLCSYDNREFNDKVDSIVLEYEYTDKDNKYTIRSHRDPNGKYITSILRYLDDECTLVESEEMVVTNSVDIHREYFSKFCKFTNTEFDKKGIYSILSDK